MTALTPEIRETLIAHAREAYENAYAPYSQFPVGAALMTTEGEIFTGCNIENITYGLSCCGERSAVYNMVSERGPLAKIQYVAVATKADIPCSPCGMCRQVMQEFGEDPLIIYKGANGYEEHSLSKLLPGAFTDFVSIDKDGNQTVIQPGA